MLAARDPQVQQQQQGIWLTGLCVRYPCSDDDRSGDQTYQKATSVPDFVPVVEPGTDWREFRWAGIVAVSPNRVLPQQTACLQACMHACLLQEV